jgi:hypothetical protein
MGDNNLYNPILGDQYIRPNGLSLRPIGVNLADLLGSFRCKLIYEIPKGAVVPANFVLIHEHNDHYSLQTAIPISPKEFCLQVKDFFEKHNKITAD